MNTVMISKSKYRIIKKVMQSRNINKIFRIIIKMSKWYKLILSQLQMWKQKNKLANRITKNKTLKME